MVTGVAGFIGARVAAMLLQEGHSVIGFDDLNDAYDPRLKHWRLLQLSRLPNFRFFREDISAKPFTSPDKVKLWTNNQTIDAIINLAARAGVRQSVLDPWIYMQTNLIGTLNLLELCRQLGIPKFILASTSSVYGLDAPLPTPEEASSDKPLQAYAASKKAAEVLCHSYHFLYGLDITVFRYFTVYGPAGRPDMSIFRFIQWIFEDRPVRIHGDGKQTRGFTYIDDIARGTIAGLKPIGYEIINLGGHEAISIQNLIDLLQEIIGKPAQIMFQPPHPADMLANQADVSKAKALLGWEPQVNLREGLHETVHWYHTERAWAKEIATD